MITRRFLYLFLLALIILILGAVFWPLNTSLAASFPEIFLGQVVLAPETKPVSARAYQSADLVLNQVGLAEIEQAYYIGVQEDILFWGSQYVGFPRTQLTEEEIRALQPLLVTASLFQEMPGSSSYQCVTHKPDQEPKLGPCIQGKGTMDQFVSFQRDAELNHTVGVLQFYLTHGRLAEIRIYPSARGLAFTPYEINGDWWLNGVTAPSPLIRGIAGRVVTPPVNILWPEMSAAQVNRRAGRIIGNRYPTAVDIIRSSQEVRQVFGEIQEIRPAEGNNYYSSWMDSTAVFLTLRVIGARGEGAVIIQGDNCFDLSMVFKGLPIDDGSGYICR